MFKKEALSKFNFCQKTDRNARQNKTKQEVIAHEINSSDAETKKKLRMLMNIGSGTRPKFSVTALYITTEEYLDA